MSVDEACTTTSQAASHATRHGGFHADAGRLSEPSDAGFDAAREPRLDAPFESSPSLPPSLRPSLPSLTLPPSSRSEELTRPYDGGTSTTPPPASFRAAPRDWCVDVGASIHTLNTFELWEALERGHVQAWMRVWREGMECWTPVGELPEFAWALSQALAQTPGALGPLAPAPLPQGLMDLDLGFDDAKTHRPPPESTPPAGDDQGSWWIAVGSAVALLALSFALLVDGQRGAPAPATSRAVAAAGATHVDPAPVAAPSLTPTLAPARAEDAHRPSRAAAGPTMGVTVGGMTGGGHEERGQHRLPRGGRSPSP